MRWRTVRARRADRAAVMSFEAIIAKVKSHPELWQSTHPFYRHRVVSARTWKEIAKELNANDCNLIKKRWKHLKDQFRKEVKKVTSNQVSLSSWVHYHELQFLTDEISKKTETKRETEESETESEEEMPLLTQRQRKRKITSVTTVSSPTVTSSPVDTTKHSSIKFRKIMRSLNNLSKSIDKSKSFANSDEHLKNDTDYMFLLSLLPTMRNLSDIQRLQFRVKINSWLLNALMENEYSEGCENKAYVQAQIKDMKPTQD